MWTLYCTSIGAILSASTRVKSFWEGYVRHTQASGYHRACIVLLPFSMDFIFQCNHWCYFLRCLFWNSRMSGLQRLLLGLVQVTWWMEFSGSYCYLRFVIFLIISQQSLVSVANLTALFSSLDLGEKLTSPAKTWRWWSRTSSCPCHYLFPSSGMPVTIYLLFSNLILYEGQLRWEPFSNQMLAI